MNAPLSTTLGTCRKLLKRSPSRWECLQAIRRVRLAGYNVQFEIAPSNAAVAEVAFAKSKTATIRVSTSALGPMADAFEMTRADRVPVEEAMHLLESTWARNRPECQWERDARQDTANAFESDLLALAGIDSREIDALPRAAVASVVGLILRGGRLDLAAACREVFNVDVRVGTIARDQGIRTWVGPLTWRQYEAFLPDPGTTAFRGLLQLASLFVGSMGVEVVLVLRRDEIPHCRAGTDSARVSRTAWAISGRPRRDVLTWFSVEQCRAILARSEETPCS